MARLGGGWGRYAGERGSGVMYRGEVQGYERAGDGNGDGKEIGGWGAGHMGERRK